MIDFFYQLLHPIQWVVAWIMVRFHDLFTAIGFNPAGGAAWSLSIVRNRSSTSSFPIP